MLIGEVEIFKRGHLPTPESLPEAWLRRLVRQSCYLRSSIFSIGMEMFTNKSWTIHQNRLRPE
jgi:hypothetical protein